jgi:hypothetical protein
VVAVTIGCLFAMVALLTFSGNARADGDSCSLSSLSSSYQPACWRPLAGSSTFNTELPASPQLAPNSSSVVNHMLSLGWSFGGSTSGYGVPRDGTHPVYFARSSDPLKTIKCRFLYGPGSCTGPNGSTINGMRIHVPAGAQPEADSDSHMTVIETGSGEEFDFWEADVTSSTISVSTGAEINADTSSGLGSQGDAAGFALSAGLLRPSELASGHINHALVVSVPCTDAVGADVGYTWPASGGWGSTCPTAASSAPELGQLIALHMTSAQIARYHAPAWQKTIMTALAHYGAYIEDVNGGPSNTGIYVLTQGTQSWTSLGLPDQWSKVARKFGFSQPTLTSRVAIPTRDLEMVNTCVTRRTCIS